MKFKLLAALAALGAAASAQASIIYVSQGVTNLGGGQYDYKYRADLSPDQKINSSSFVNFAVIYDFLGYVSSSTVIAPTASGFNLVTQTPFTNTQPYAQNVPDSATIINVVTYIQGIYTPVGNTNNPLYTIDIISTNAPANTLAYQSAQLEKNNPGQPSDSTGTGNTVLIQAPGTVAGVPEPGTTSLMGLGLAGFSFWSLRRKNRA